MIAIATLVNVFQGLTRLRGRGFGPGFSLVSGLYCHLADRRVLKQIARLSPHLMRDMGFDAEEVRAAAGGEMRVSEPFRRRLARKQLESSEAAPPERQKAETGTDGAAAIVREPRLETTGGACC
ncbi:MAG: hypothetical protein KKH72_09510 [Alphaproteobacteria bacterium]|nr:hypothetical protein [Alphaproteobacteria bacterium]